MQNQPYAGSTVEQGLSILRLDGSERSRSTFGRFLRSHSLVFSKICNNPEDELRAVQTELGEIIADKHAIDGLVRIDSSFYHDGVRRPQSTPTEQSPHADGAYNPYPPQIIALCCVSEAEEGESTFVYPQDLLEALISQFDLGEVATAFAPDSYTVIRGEKSRSRAIFEVWQDGEDERITTIFSSHEFNVSVPNSCSPEVFKFIEEYSRNPENQLIVKLSAGECVFFLNGDVMHGRKGWTDSESNTRYVIRAWYNADSNSFRNFKSGILVTDQLNALISVVKNKYSVGSQRS